MPEPSQLKTSSTRVFSLAMVVIGVLLIVRTIAAGGGAIATGVILGALFLVGGIGRLYLQWRR